MSAQIRFTKTSAWAPEGPQSNVRLHVQDGTVLSVPEQCPRHIAERAVEKGKAEWVEEPEPQPQVVEPKPWPEPGPKPKAERKKRRSYRRKQPKDDEA